MLGGEWVWTFALVSASAFIVLPLAAALGTTVAAVAAAYLLGPYDAGLYYASIVGWRTVIFASTVWIVAAITQLSVARAALARAAVVDERARLEAALRAALGGRLAALAVTARQAQALSAVGRDEEVARLLASLAAEARTAREETRRAVTQLRGDEARDELRAARKLLASDDVRAEARA